MPYTLTYFYIERLLLHLYYESFVRYLLTQHAPVDESLEVASLLAGFLRIAVLVGMCVSNALKKLYSCEHLQSHYFRGSFHKI